MAAKHEPIAKDAFGIPYFEHVQGPDGRWNWAKCPRCGVLVKDGPANKPARHWAEAVAAEGGQS